MSIKLTNKLASSLPRQVPRAARLLSRSLSLSLRRPVIAISARSPCRCKLENIKRLPSLPRFSFSRGPPSAKIIRFRRWRVYKKRKKKQKKKKKWKQTREARDPAAIGRANSRAGNIYIYGGAILRVCKGRLVFDGNERRQRRPRGCIRCLPEKKSEVWENSLIRRQRDYNGKGDGRRGAEGNRRCCRIVSPILLFRLRALSLSLSLSLPLRFHAKHCFHGAVISFSQPTYSPSHRPSAPVFRCHFPLFATPPLSSPEFRLELSVHFHLHDLRPDTSSAASADSSTFCWFRPRERLLGNVIWSIAEIRVSS